MLISALCDYYDILAAAGKVLPRGYSRVGIHYLVALRPDGSIAEIVDYQTHKTIPQKNDKVKDVTSPRDVIMPKRTEKSAVDANVVEHRAVYLFGLNLGPQGLDTADSTNKAQKSHSAFVEKNLSFLEGLHSPVIDAYRNFMESWAPEQQRENSFLLALGNAYPTAKFAFCLAGRPDLLLHEDPLLKAKWEAELPPEEGEGEPAQCAITGEIAPIPPVHGTIAGSFFGSTAQCKLVMFNNSAVESYGKRQSQNSNISQLAMRKYTEALNALVADPLHRTKLGDLVVVHWAMSPSDVYDQLVNQSFFQGFVPAGEYKMDAQETDSLLDKLLSEAKAGAMSGKQLDISGALDPDVVFYMVGLKANSSRLAVEFIYRNRFGKLFESIAEHQRDLQMSEDGRLVSLNAILNELFWPRSKSKDVDPSLFSRMMTSICGGLPYPIGLLYAVLRRIKADSDDKKRGICKLNPLRAGILKAYLNRKSRISGQEEAFSMALNPENTNQAYLCGRLFAVLEKLQQDAAGGNLNRTIRDAYFAAACSTPSLVFSRLLILAQHHIPKAKRGDHWVSLIRGILSKIGDEFPSPLSPEEQGKFILGYYQQDLINQDGTAVEKAED